MRREEKRREEKGREGKGREGKGREGKGRGDNNGCYKKWCESQIYFLTSLFHTPVSINKAKKYCKFNRCDSTSVFVPLVWWS